MTSSQEEMIAAYEWAFYRSTLKRAPSVTYVRGWYQVWSTSVSHHSYRLTEFGKMMRRLDLKAEGLGRPKSWNGGKYLDAGANAE